MRGAAGARVVLVAAIAAAAAAAWQGDWAHALEPSSVRVSSVDWVLAEGTPARLAEVRLALAGAGARDVRVRLGGAAWIRCRVTGASARCSVPSGQASVERLARLSVVAVG